MSEISAISPGVMGTTGVDTGEIIMGIVQNIKLDLIVEMEDLIKFCLIIICFLMLESM